MNLLSAIFLGIIQGLTEFLPVSSSGHLVLSQYFLGLGESSDNVFEIFLHMGTLIAVIVYFRKMLWDMVISMFHWGNNVDSQTHLHNRFLVLYLGISTFVTGVFYLLFSDFLESMFTKPMLVAIMLSVTGVIIFCSDFIKDRGVPAMSMGPMRSILIGLGQGIAIIPGISRSGTTISISVMSGIKRKDAAQFSFLLSIPAILGANISVVKELSSLNYQQFYMYFAGFIAAFISGYLVISLLIRLIQQSKLKYFAFYVWIVSIIAIVSLIIY